MALIVVSGDLGSGKTLLTTYMALKDERPVFANYDIKLGGRFHVASPGSIERINEPSLVILDEIYQWLNARLSTTAVNVYLSSLVFQSRKRKLDIVGTLQLTRTLDVLFREMADLVIVAKKIDDGFGYEVINMYHERIIKRFQINDDLAKQIYPYYDTYQKISSIHRYSYLNVDTDPDELNQVIDEIIKEIRAGSVSDTPKKEFLRNWLLRHSYPPKLYTYVYDRMVSGG